MLQSVDHEAHKRRRAPLNPFFSKASVASRQDMIHGFANKLCDRIAQFEGSTVNITAAVSAFTRDVAMQFVLSKDYRNLDNQDFGVEMTNVLRKQHFFSIHTSPAVNNAALSAPCQATNTRKRALGRFGVLRSMSDGSGR
jgi:cytochrome P450